MSNKNFGEPWEGKIERIRENLGEGRYAQVDGIFPIVKELIQNAEDAKASGLLIAWDEGLPKARHPLLRAAGLLAINDGGFDSANGRAIREMGLSSKAADSSTIGKFGLGMKSVFHLGEVFFFLAIDKLGGRIDADIRSPWSADEGGLHPDWDDFCDEDKLAVEQRVRSLFGTGPWFCLWVPLRRREHCGGVDPIERFFPGDKSPVDLFSSKQIGRVPTLLPLLTHLRTIDVSLGSDKFSGIQIEAGSSRRTPLDAGPVEISSTPMIFTGKIASMRLEASVQHLYAGLEFCPNDRQLAEIGGHENWPRRSAIDPSTGRSQQVKEKASAHAAACCVASRAPEGQGELRLHWAVFLPLGQPKPIEITDCSWSVDIFLHGWFFPNSGRTAVEAIDEEESERMLAVSDSWNTGTVRRNWNRRLARCGTLPLVPSAFCAIADQCQWDDQVISSITRALQLSALYARFAADICQSDAWVRRLSKNGDYAWQKIPADKAIYEIPGSDAGHDICAVFPAVHEIAPAEVIVVRDSPRLAAGPAQRWPSQLVSKLLRSASSDLLVNSAKAIDYLVCFVDESAPEQTWSVHAEDLVDLARSILMKARQPIKGESRKAIRQFLSRLPSDRRIRLRLELSEGSAGELFAVLCESTESVVWIPDEFASDDSTCVGKLTATDAMQILQKLAQWSQRSLTSPEAERLGVVAAQVFRATTDVGTLLTAAGNIELFNGTRCRDRRKDARVSWSDIVENHRRRVLFVKPSPMAYQLQEAIPDENIVLISKELAEAIFGASGSGPAQCREGQLLAALAVAEKPKLGSVSSRRALFQTLLKFRDGRDDPSFRSCLRYLLHGRPECFSASDSLLVQGPAGTVWWRLAKLSLDALGQQWRIADGAFATIISDDDRREIGVAEVNTDVALELADLVDPNSFEILRPSEVEYRDLLKQIVDDDLLRRLPVHEDRNGAFTRIGADCYWESNRALPDGLEHNVRVLKRASDEGTWKRQQQLAEPLGAPAVMKIALSQKTPAVHWALIMDCLRESEHVSGELLNQLRTTVWVPTADGSTVKPEDIVHLPELQDDVARLVSQYPGVFVDPGALSPAIQHHGEFARLLSIAAPSRGDALGMVGTLLLEEPRNCIGGTGIEFDEWLEAFHSDADELFPCISFLRKARQALRATADSTFRELARGIDERRTRELLDWLRESHRSERATGRRGKIVVVFGKYLRSVVKADKFAEQMKTIQLPAKDGSWRTPAELCVANDGVAPNHVVDPGIENCIDDLLPAALKNDSPFAIETGNAAKGLREPDWKVETASNRLREFFDGWRDVIPNEQIGGFLALLGDDPGVRNLSQEFLGRNRTLDGTREKFGLPEVQCGRDPMTGAAVMEDAPTMIMKQRVVVEIARDAVVQVLNLLGEPINVARNERPSTLFVGYGSRVKPFPQRFEQGCRILCFRLNAIDPRSFSENELGRLLRDSAAKFIVEAYNSFEQQTTFALAWEDLAASDQLDIRITQLRIIEHGFLILDQYGLRTDPELARVLDLWDAAERLKAERDSKTERPRRGQMRNPELDLQTARDQLREVLESRPATQQQILAAVRHRVADYYQYKPDSIPFELFQNADDAYVELARFFPGAIDTRPGSEASFEVIARDNCVAFVHLGRRINQYPLDQDREAHGFDNDLWKMSVLSLSNKGHSADTGQGAVTGKFGLGFKSVFLACDRPRILSGRLVFEFLGGIYPRRLMGDERRSLDELHQKQTQKHSQATVLELELRAGLDSEGVVGRFRKLAHILVVFARQIRWCIVGHGKPTTWHAKDVPGISGCQSGELTPISTLSDGAAAFRAMVFRSDEGDLLFALGSRGFERFAADVPSIWVTAPTEENLGIGFLVNGRFALDVGRAQLARDPAQNEEVALRLGRQFGEKLAELCRGFEVPVSRAEIIRALRFAADTTPYDLWNSLWNLLVQGVSARACRDEPAERLVRDVLWGSTDSGSAGFISTHPVIPVRLPGKRFERDLVALEQIRFCVKGIISKGDGYALSCVSEWPEVKERLGNSRLVSDEEVVAPLRIVCPKLVATIRTIGIAEIMGWELRHTTVDPGQAEQLGELITKKFLDDCDKTEQSLLEGQLRGLEFKALDGRYYLAKKLVIGHVPPGLVSTKHNDERLRAAFAPRERVLSSDYTAKGLAFFEASRKELDAPPRELAYWMLAANDQTKRRAALLYLADGDLGPGVQDELKKRGIEGTWLESLVNCKEFEEMTTQQKGRLLGLLPEGEAEEIVKTAVEQSPHQTVVAEHCLRAILAWWEEQRTWRLAEYERKVFPNGRLKFLTNGDDAQAQRKDWVILFLLGLTHTMGRTQAEAHRGFLRQCDRDGKLDMIASSDREPGRWMTWIDTYLDRQIDESTFLQWMKQFVGIYQVSRHLDDYIEAFLAVERFKSPFSLTQVSNTKASSAHQGGGISAPPLSRVLGMGQCFVLRELMRQKVLKNSLAHRHCYVPVVRVRRMLLIMGCDSLLHRQRPWEWSSTIHSFLRDNLGSTDAATFHGDFDIPLQIVAEDSELQARFFNAGISLDDEDEDAGLWTHEDEVTNGDGV